MMAVFLWLEFKSVLANALFYYAREATRKLAK